MPEEYYQDRLYPLQDRVLQLMQDINSPFYLTGGTALSRCYLGHRYSDDLDFFLNADPHFQSCCRIVIDNLSQIPGWQIQFGATAESFVRLFLKSETLFLKIDFVNDIKFRYGDIEECSIYNRVDNWRNILSNKLCSLSRRDVKDIVDILFLSMQYRFPWEEVVAEAKQKDLWVDALEICKIIKELPVESFRDVKWMSKQKVDFEKISLAIDQLHDDIFWGKDNSLQGRDIFSNNVF